MVDSTSIQPIVLNTSDLHIGYTGKSGDKKIAGPLNLNLKRGELVCLIGKNGIGKSTLLRTLSKMQAPLEGKIKIDLQDLDQLSHTALAHKISLVLTERIPNSNLRVEELIALGRQPYTNWIGKLSEQDLKEINEAVKESHLEDLLGQKCNELSDGQLQRAMICRALAQKTDLIILDEPTAHLDIQHKIETFQLLKKIAHQLGRGVLISTHEIQLALQMSDKIWMMLENEMITERPHKLISSDKINLLFDSNSISFDKESCQFIVK